MGSECPFLIKISVFVVNFSHSRALFSDSCHASFLVSPCHSRVSQQSSALPLHRVEWLNELCFIQSVLILNILHVQIALNSTLHSLCCPALHLHSVQSIGLTVQEICEGYTYPAIPSFSREMSVTLQKFSSCYLELNTLLQDILIFNLWNVRLGPDMCMMWKKDTALCLLKEYVDS